MGGDLWFALSLSVLMCGAVEAAETRALQGAAEADKPPAEPAQVAAPETLTIPTLDTLLVAPALAEVTVNFGASPAPTILIPGSVATESVEPVTDITQLDLSDRFRIEIKRPGWEASKLSTRRFFERVNPLLTESPVARERMEQTARRMR